MTKREAIEGHRKMWSWIADEIERRESIQKIAVLKKEYCMTNGLDLSFCCFCCEYQEYINETCDIGCPLIWGNNLRITCTDPSSEYMEINLTKRWTEQIYLARQIANLPERPLLAQIGTKTRLW